MNELSLPGCTPEPLMGYLKALGVFRLVSQQADSQARAAWKDGGFVLRTKLSREELAEFFVTDYSPNPIFSPWNGRGGFLSDSGASNTYIEKIKASTVPRLNQLRQTIAKIESMSILREFGAGRARVKFLDKKKKTKTASPTELEELRTLTAHIKNLKENILYQIRAEFPDQSLGWFDTCLQIGQNGFSVSPALGSGGVDGSMDFSANFLGHVLTVLGHPKTGSWINASLYAEGLAQLENASIGQFAPGNSGGPNATQGFEGSSSINPWDYLLLLEGSSLLAGSLSRRCNSANSAKAAFPFTVMPLAQDADSVEAKDSNSARGELWLPLWNKFLRLEELTGLFGEGRAEWSRRQSRTSVDFAKAISSFGVDRGIESFSRHGLLQRSGLNFLATPLGRFEVGKRENVDLLREADPWIERFRRACGDKSPARFGSALRQLDSAVFDYCRFGSNERFQTILLALGRAERDVASGERFRADATTGMIKVPPLNALSPAWIDSADDRSPEFEIAVALASIRGIPGKILGIRENLEPVAFNKGRLEWQDESSRVAWTHGGLVENLVAVLERRLVDYQRLGLPYLPIASERFVSASTLAAFLSEETDDEKIEKLLWGLIACKVHRTDAKPEQVAKSNAPLPRSFALLKFCFNGLSGAEHPADPSTHELTHKLCHIQPDSRILHLTRTGQLADAIRLATARLHAHELTPARISWSAEGVDPVRMAAALLFPVGYGTLNHFWTIVRHLRREEPVT